MKKCILFLVVLTFVFSSVFADQNFLQDPTIVNPNTTVSKTSPKPFNQTQLPSKSFKNPAGYPVNLVDSIYYVGTYIPAQSAISHDVANNAVTMTYRHRALADMYVQTSKDGGATFQRSVKINVGSNRYPSTLAGYNKTLGAGTSYAVWTSAASLPTVPGRALAVSKDELGYQGGVWAPEVYVTPNSSHWVVCPTLDEDGNVYMVSRGPTGANINNFNGGAYFWKVKESDLSNAGVDKVIIDSAAIPNSNYPVLKYGKNGTAYIMMDGIRPDRVNYELVYWKTTDYGATWSEAHWFDNNKIDGVVFDTINDGLTYRYDMTVDDNNVPYFGFIINHAIDTINSEYNIYVAHPENNVWKAKKVGMLSDWYAGTNFLQMATDGHNIFVTWIDTTISGQYYYYDIFGTVSKDGGNTWSVPMNISQTPTLDEEYAHLADRVGDNLQFAFDYVWYNAAGTARDTSELYHMSVPKQDLLNQPIQPSGGSEWTHAGILPAAGVAGHGLQVDPDGKIWVAFYGKSDSIPSKGSAGQDTVKKVSAIQVFNPDGTHASFSPIKVLNIPDGTVDTLFNAGRGLGIDNNGNMLYSAYDMFYRIDYKTGQCLHKVQPKAATSLTKADADDNGYVYIGHVLNGNPIHVFDANFEEYTKVTESTNGISRCLSVTSDGKDLLYACLSGSNGIEHFRSDDGPDGTYSILDTLGYHPGHGKIIVAQHIEFDRNGLVWLGSNVQTAVPWGWWAFDPTDGWKIVDSVSTPLDTIGDKVQSPRGQGWSLDGKTMYTNDFVGQKGRPEVVRIWTNPSPAKPGVSSIKNNKQINVTKNFSLQQSYPNPFNPTCVIPFSLSKSGKVTLEVYNLMGQKVETLVNEYKSAGQYKAVFNASGKSAGVYFYKLTVDSKSETKKMVLMK